MLKRACKHATQLSIGVRRQQQMKMKWIMLALSSIIMIALSLIIMATDILSINAPLPSKAIVTELNIMMSSGQTCQAYKYEAHGIEWSLCADENDMISYIQTKDQDFSTPEGIQVGSTLTQVHKVSDEKLLLEPGWGHHLRLLSGWSVAFWTDRREERIPPEQNDTVKWIFKR